jgi:hypothetical protein
MARVEDLETAVSRREADRLFREDAVRRRSADPRLVKWFGPPAGGREGERTGRLLTTAFTVFCIVGGIAMALGVTLLPATALSALTFVVIGILARLF